MLNTGSGKPYMPVGILVSIDKTPIPATVTEVQNRGATLKAVRAGAKIILRVARSAAPKGLGHLKRAQGIKAAKMKKGKTGSYAVQGAKTKYVKVVKAGSRSASGMKRVVPAFYDHLVQGGVKPHSIRKGSKVTRTGKGGKVTAAVGQGTGKPHPGHRANPYRRRAYEGVAQEVNREVLRVMGVELQKIINKNALKLAAKASKAKG